MKIFITGPMTGLPDYNRAAFFDREKELYQKYPGCLVINPARLNYDHLNHHDAVMLNIPVLLTCSHISILPGVHGESLSSIEIDLARYLEIKEIT